MGKMTYEEFRATLELEIEEDLAAELMAQGIDAYAEFEKVARDQYDLYLEEA